MRDVLAGVLLVILFVVLHRTKSIDIDWPGIICKYAVCRPAPALPTHAPVKAGALSSNPFAQGRP